MDDERKAQQTGVGGGAGELDQPHRAADPNSMLVAMFTPCHGAQVFFEAASVVAGAVVSTVCSRCGHRWQIDLEPGERAEDGLRPTWAQRLDSGGR